MTTPTEHTMHGVHSDEQLMNAIVRLAHNKHTFPQLRRAEERARLDLAAAILAYEASLLEHGEGPGNPELALLAARTEVATAGYAQALTDLVRGDEPDN